MRHGDLVAVRTDGAREEPSFRAAAAQRVCTGGGPLSRRLEAYDTFHPLPNPVSTKLVRMTDNALSDAYWTRMRNAPPPKDVILTLCEAEKRVVYAPPCTSSPPCVDAVLSYLVCWVRVWITWSVQFIFRSA